MTLEELAKSLGAGTVGAAIMWLGKWAVGREHRIATESKAHAEVEKVRVATTGQTTRARIEADEHTGSHALELVKQEHNDHGECRRLVAELQVEVALLRKEHGQCPGRISELEGSVESLKGLVVDLAARVARHESEPPPAAAE